MPKARLPRWVQARECAERTVYRATCMRDGERWYGPQRETADKAHSDAVEYRRRRSVAGATGITLGEAFDIAAEQIEETRAAATAKTFRNSRRTLERVFDPKRPLLALTRRDVETYARHRLKTVRPITVRGELSALLWMVNIASRRGFEVPTCDLRVELPRVVMPRRVAWSGEQIRDLLQRMRTSGRRDAAAHADLYEMLWLSGLRRAELARMRVEDVDVATERLYVRGKTGARTLPLTGRLREVVESMLTRAAPNGLLFRGGTRGISTVFELWRRRGEMLNAHALRHSFATAIASSGVSAHVLASLMGHATLQMSMVYVHATSRDARAAMASLELPQTPVEAPSCAPRKRSATRAKGSAQPRRRGKRRGRSG